jgi:hypothetical protein
MGQVNYAGNMSVSASTSPRKKYYWETYTLLGDPSVVPYTGRPDSFKIALPDTLPNGINSLSLTIAPFAYMAISHFDTLWDASYASPSGSVVLDMPGVSDDSCLIVITGQNRVPLIKKIYISDISKEYINLTSSALDDASGNNNGIADWGESLFLKLTIGNLGLSDATHLYAKISTSSDLVTIVNDSVDIGTLPAKSQIVLSDNFGIRVAKLIPDKGYITLNLKLKDSKTEKNYLIDICVHAPVLEILNCTIDDSVAGNGNFIADPGETINLMFKVSNSGSSSISGTYNITNQPAGLTIPEPVVNTGVLEYGESSFIPVTVNLSPEILPGSVLNISTWIITDGDAYEGQYSARSGVISDNTESLLKITVNLPLKDSVKFLVKVSSELEYDFLIFRLNGTEIFRISGETGWIGKKNELKEGFNILEWIYKKDQDIVSGADCAWLDYISFPAISFSRIDLKTGKIVTPEPNKSYNLEQVTAQVINFGTDTIKHFNLAYIVNNNTPVSQQFNKLIKSGDTTIVAFTQTADLSVNGTYKIKVYGFNNNDNYIVNDTASLTIINTDITPIENPETRIKVIPNPFSQNFRLLIDSKITDEIRISIFSTAGKLLWEDEAAVAPGENIFTISPDVLPSGFYTLRITGRTTLKAVRIVKSE